MAQTCMKCGKPMSAKAEYGPESADKNFKNFILRCSDPNCDYVIAKQIPVANIRYDERLVGPLTLKQATYLGIVLIILGYLYFGN